MEFGEKKSEEDRMPKPNHIPPLASYAMNDKSYKLQIVHL